MKKIIKISVAMMLVMALVFAMAACGGSSDSSSDAEEEASVVGEWTLTTIVDADGNEYTLEEYCAEQGVDAAGLSMNFTFGDDDTFTAEIGGIEATGTYTFDGETCSYTMDSNNQTAEAKYDADSDTLYAEDANSGMKSIMERK